MRCGFSGRPCRAGSIGRFVVAAAAGFGALLAAALAYARWIEPRRLQAVVFRVGVPGLPAALEGTRIAHLTDFHAGTAGTHLPTLRRAVAVARDWRPDLVALTGDFADDGRWRRDLHLFENLATAAPTVAVLGNHDRMASPAATERIVAGLKEQGVTVLRNEHRIVPVPGGALEVVAVDDPSTDRDDTASALAGLPPHPNPARPAVLLGHAPDVVDRAPAGRFALALAGHTHGGQIRSSPFRRKTPLDISMTVGGLDSPYARETHLVRGIPLFVSNGLGQSGVPFRFLAPPQVALFVLTASLDESKDADDPDRFIRPASAAIPIPPRAGPPHGSRNAG